MRLQCVRIEMKREFSLVHLEPLLLIFNSQLLRPFRFILDPHCIASVTTFPQVHSFHRFLIRLFFKDILEEVTFKILSNVMISFPSRNGHKRQTREQNKVCFSGNDKSSHLSIFKN